MPHQAETAADELRITQPRLIAAAGVQFVEGVIIGVLGSLTPAQAQNINRNTQRDPSKDKLDHIDATHLVRIVSRNFDRAFSGVFNDFRKTQSWLMQVESARNDWAHPRTGDMLADEVGHSLYAMVQVLGTAKLPEAAEVERIRKNVLVMEPPQAGLQVKEVRQAGPGQLPYWWEVCEPHDAFKNPATIDESLFAATLGGVHAGSARPEYLEPDNFFAHTHFTDNLKQTRYNDGVHQMAMHSPLATIATLPSTSRWPGAALV
jgi:hypothetical protein